MSILDLALAPVQQRQILHTQILGPESQRLQQSRDAAVPAGMGTVLPIWVDRSEGGQWPSSVPATSRSRW